MKEKEIINLVFTETKKTKMTYRDLLDAQNGISWLNGLKLDVVIAFQVSTFLKNNNKLLFEWNISRDKKIKEWGAEDKDEKGHRTGGWKVLPENQSKFDKWVDEFLNQEIEIDHPVFTFTDLKITEIEPAYLTNILWMFEI